MPCVACPCADFAPAREYVACPACGLEQRLARYDPTRLLHEAIELQARKEREYQPFGRRLSHHVLDHAASNARVLDYACGTSASLREAQRHRPLQCVRADRSPTVCAWLEQHCAENKRDEVLHTGDLGECGGGFNLVLLFDVLQEVREPAHVLRMAGRALAPGGRVLVTTHHDPGNAFHARRFHADDVVNMAARCGLRLIAAAERPDVNHFCLTVLAASDEHLAT